MITAVIEARVPEYGYEALVARMNESVERFGDFRIRIVFPAQYVHSKALRDLVSYVLQKNRINPPWNRRFALISDELVNNAIEHGSAEEDEDVFELSVMTDPDGSTVFRISVSDAGHGKTRKTAEEMDALRQTRLAKGFESHVGNRGRGLFQIIEGLVDALEFRDNPNGGLTVCVTKKFLPEGSPTVD